MRSASFWIRPRGVVGADQRSVVSPLPVLYSFRRCPYAMRARLALRYAGVQVVLREVVLRNKPQQLRDASPKATVPVLCLADGTVLDESLHIMQWALAQADPEGWQRASDQALVHELISRNDGPFKVLLDKYKYPNRDTSRAQSAYRDEAVALHLSPLEGQLEARRYLLAETPTLADMALLPFVRQFAMVDSAWFETAALPLLRGWLEGLVASPLFDAVMIKLEPWQSGDAETVF